MTCFLNSENLGRRVEFPPLHLLLLQLLKPLHQALRDYRSWSSKTASPRIRFCFSPAVQTFHSEPRWPQETNRHGQSANERRRSQKVSQLLRTLALREGGNRTRIRLPADDAVARKPRLAGGWACEEESSSTWSSHPSPGTKHAGEGPAYTPSPVKSSDEQKPQPCVRAITRGPSKQKRPVTALWDIVINSHC